MRGRGGQSDSHLLVQSQRVDFRQHPAHTAIPATHQDPKSGELLKEAQPGQGREKELTDMDFGAPDASVITGWLQLLGCSSLCSFFLSS